MVPGIVLWNQVIKFWVSVGSVERAESVIDEMNAADHFTWNQLIKGWVNSGRPDAVDKAEALKGRMMLAGVDPDTYTFTTLLSLYAKNGDAGRAQFVVDEMSKTSANGKSKQRPCTATHNALLASNRNSSDISIAPSDKANAIWQHMIDSDDPLDDRWSFNIVIATNLEYDVAGQVTVEGAEPVVDP